MHGQLTGSISISPGDAGVTIVGAPGSQISGNILVSAHNVRLQRLQVIGSVTVSSSDNFSLRESNITRGVVINGGSGSQLSHNQMSDVVTALKIAGNANNVVVRSNTFSSAVHSVTLGDLNNAIVGGANNIALIDNTMTAVPLGFAFTPPRRD